MEQKNLAREGGSPYFVPLTDPEDDQKQHDKVVAEAEKLEKKNESAPLDVA